MSIVLYFVFLKDVMFFNIGIIIVSLPSDYIKLQSRNENACNVLGVYIITIRINVVNITKLIYFLCQKYNTHTYTEI